MNVQVKINDYTHTICTSAEDTVADVLCKICNLTGRTAASHLLLLNDFKPMTERARLCHYNLGSRDFIRVQYADQLTGEGNRLDQSEVPDGDEDVGRDLIDHLADSTDGMENDILQIQADWEPLQRDNLLDLLRKDYDLADYYSVWYSTKVGALRVLTVGTRQDGPAMAIVRYFTMANVWARSRQDGIDQSWKWEEEVETPLAMRDVIADIIPKPPNAHKRLDTVLQIRSRLAGQVQSNLRMSEVTHKTDDQGHTTGYSGSYDRADDATCPLCDGSHRAQWQSRRYDNSVRSSCSSSQKRAARMPESTIFTMYGRWRNPLSSTPAKPPRAPDPKNRTQPWGPAPQTRAIKPRNQMRVIHWNTDKRATNRNAIGALIMYMIDQDVDVACLQEVETANIDTLGVQALGYNVYRHGKVAILVSITTAEPMHEPGCIWRSRKFDSMSITMVLPKGTLLIGRTYNIAQWNRHKRQDKCRTNPGHAPTHRNKQPRPPA